MWEARRFTALQASIAGHMASFTLSFTEFSQKPELCLVITDSVIILIFRFKLTTFNIRNLITSFSLIIISFHAMEDNDIFTVNKSGF
jgi:hypothetical protein